jgi:hypothetical protein
MDFKSGLDRFMSWNAVNNQDQHPEFIYKTLIAVFSRTTLLPFFKQVPVYNKRSFVILKLS